MPCHVVEQKVIFHSPWFVEFSTLVIPKTCEKNFENFENFQFLVDDVTNYVSDWENLCEKCKKWVFY